jgi:hypothetical protein
LEDKVKNNDENEITGRWIIADAIKRKSEIAGKIIGEWLFDEWVVDEKGMSLKLWQAARRSGKEYKMVAVLMAINDLPDKKLKNRRKK